MTETDTIATAAAATPAAEEATDLAALAELTAQRSAVYRLLARLYRVEVDEEFLAELKAMRFPAATGNTAVDAGYRAIATYLSGADAHAITDLAVDYVRAFIGHGVDAYSAAYPFESVYTSPKRLMMQEARDEVLAVYRSEGLDKLPQLEGVRGSHRAGTGVHGRARRPHRDGGRGGRRGGGGAPAFHPAQLPGGSFGKLGAAHDR